MSAKKIIENSIVTYNKYNGRRLWKGAGVVTEIKRFVSYIYMYKNGVKESNVGFAKVDSRNGQCKIVVNIKGLEQSNGKCEKVYLFYRKQEEIVGIYIGSFQIINGIGEFHEQFQTENIKGTNLALDEMNGIFVREEDRNQRVFASGWDDYAIVVNRFCVHNNETNVVSIKESEKLLHASEVEEQKKEPIIFYDRNWKEETVRIEQMEEKGEEGTTKTEEALGLSDKEGIEVAEEMEEVEQNTQTEAQNIEEKADKEIGSDLYDKLEGDYEQKTEKEREDFERGVKRGQKMDMMLKEEIELEQNNKEREEEKEQNKREQEIADLQNKQEEPHTDFSQGTLSIEQEQKSEFMRQTEGIETVTFENADGERSVTSIHNRANRIEDVQKDTENLQNGLLWETPVPSVWKEMSWEEYQKKEEQLKKQVQKCMQRKKNQQEIDLSGSVQQNGIPQRLNQSESINQPEFIQPIRMQPRMNQSRRVQQTRIQPEVAQPKQMQQTRIQPGMDQRQMQRTRMQPGGVQLRQVQQTRMQPNRMEEESSQAEYIEQDHIEDNHVENNHIEQAIDWLDQEPSNEFQQDITKQGEPIQSNKEWQDSISEDWENGQIELENSVTEDIQKPEETMWDRLCHQFPKIRAFVDEPESLCLKIDLRDLRMLPKENWILGNNSFLLHGYYNFRYLILTQEKGEFVLGIPGIYHPNEKMMASMFGFGDFKPVKVCEKMLGQFGYWCKEVAL